VLAALFRAAFVAGLIEAALRVVSFPALLRLVGVKLGPLGEARVRTETGRALEGLLGSPAVRAGDIVFRNWPTRNNCLRRALLFGYLLRVHRPVLRIGVRRDQGELCAHAWLEVAGEPVLEAEPVGGFTVLERRAG
jgi:hypothetical protein